MPTADGKLFYKCSRKGCINRARWGLKICVPAKGTRAFEYAPITALVNVMCCEEHVKLVRYEEFANEQQQNQFLAHTKAKGLKKPDFARGYMDGVELDSKEWQAFQASLRAKAN